MSAADALLIRQAGAVALRAADFDPNLRPSLVAEILGVSEKTLRKWRSTGEAALPYEKIGKLVFYRSSVVEQFRQKNTVIPAAMVAAGNA